jgi:hypothetical protein
VEPKARTLSFYIGPALNIPTNITTIDDSIQNSFYPEGNATQKNAS